MAPKKTTSPVRHHRPHRSARQRESPARQTNRGKTRTPRQTNHRLRRRPPQKSSRHQVSASNASPTPSIASSHGADPESVTLVRNFAKEFRLKVEPDTPGPERRTVKLTGTVADMQKAFGISLSHQTLDGVTYRVREGSIDLPSELIGHVVAVLGLDNRPQAHASLSHQRPRRRHRRPQRHKAEDSRNPTPRNISYSPVQVAQLYGFPPGATAADQTIGHHRVRRRLPHRRHQGLLQIPRPESPEGHHSLRRRRKKRPIQRQQRRRRSHARHRSRRRRRSRRDASSSTSPPTPTRASSTPSPPPSTTPPTSPASSPSAGAPPNPTGPRQSMNALDAACQSAAALGITITVAAGDDGSTDGVTDGKNHVDFPASSPHVLACGGTNLQASGATITSETVWNDLPTAAQPAAASATSSPCPLGRPTPASPSPPTPPAAVAFPTSPATPTPPPATTSASTARLRHRRHQRRRSPLGRPHRPSQPAERQIRRLPPTRHLRRQRQSPPSTTSPPAQQRHPCFKAGPGWDACTGLGSPIAPQLIKVVSHQSMPRQQLQRPRKPRKNQQRKPRKRRKSPSAKQEVSPIRIR